MHVVELICEQTFCLPLIQCSASWCVLVRRGPQVSKTARDRVSKIEAAVKQPVYLFLTATQIERLLKLSGRQSEMIV